MNHAKPLLFAVALASLTLPACTGATGEVEEQADTAEEQDVTSNALSFNALSFNALSFNALSFNALSFNGLQSDALLRESLKDPNARQVLKYVVSCALPASESISVTVQGTEFDFPGGLGLAPEWGEPHGSCGSSCQHWVSACVISRLDFLGKRTEISLRGDNDALDTSRAERGTFTAREATYYGDIFVEPQRLFACLSPGKTEIPRVCGPSIRGCGVDVLGSCDKLCGQPRLDGSFPDCRVPGGPRQKDEVFHAAVTVFLDP